MNIWWESLTAFQQSMFVIASTATIIMIIFLILMLFGLHGDSFDGGVDVSGDFDPSAVGHGDFDASIHGDTDVFNHEPLSSFSGLKIITVRGVLAFLSVGAWVAFLVSTSLNAWFASMFGIVSGAIASILLAYAFKQMMKLESEGNIQYENALGKNGTVYMRIPANKMGKGKVNVTIQEHFVEVDAITPELTDIKPGEIIIVTGVENENTVIVKRQE